MGMTPNDWREVEARRAERAQRAGGNPHGRPLGNRSRAIAGWILGLAAVAMVAYAVLALLGIIDVGAA